eukprot:7629690-Alexandrium_andersonii.AAC.1
MRGLLGASARQAEPGWRIRVRRAGRLPGSPSGALVRVGGAAYGWADDGALGRAVATGLGEAREVRAVARKPLCER